MTAPLAIQVRDHDQVRDVSLTLADDHVTIAEVLDVLELPANAVIDGHRVTDPHAVAAVDVLVAGSQVVAPELIDLADNAGLGADRVLAPEDQPELDVSVVAGLDAGASIRLAPGLHRVAASTLVGEETSAPEWFVDVANGSRPVDQVSPPRPWDEHGGTVETVLVDGAVLALGQPVDPEPGYSDAVHRPPRKLGYDQVIEIDFGEPLSDPATPTALSWATLLAPVPIAIMMAFFFRPIFALFAAMGPLMALGRWYESKRSFRRSCALVDKQRSERQHQIDALSKQQAATVATQRWQAHPHVAELWRRVRTRSVRLWERRPGTPGYLESTVGVGPATVEARTLNGELDEPLVIRPVPHVVDLQANIGVGVHGERAHSLAVARSIVLQLATLHGPADLMIGLVARPDAAPDWDWLKWLPHTDRNMSATRSAAVAKQVADLQLNESRSAIGSWTQTSNVRSVRLFVIDDDQADVAAIVKAATTANEHVRFVVVARQPTALPAVCSSVVAVSAKVAELATPQFAGRSSLVCPVGVSEPTAQSWARGLSSFVDPEAAVLDRRSDGAVSLLRLLQLDSAQALMSRWAQRSTSGAARTLLGECDDGVFEIDLTADGPHALIAGTTGSGKSELLRTLVVGLAVDCPPEFLNFVLIDFKGGGAFDALADLPHVAGLITDLDTTLVERAITSLRSELQRREALFRTLGVSTYEQAVTELVEPLARLVVVIDEFAALATDYSELLTALVDLAARGRSLGMHLVLATQRPSGVVDQKIRANTNLRIALRVQDAFDSHDVIGVADAVSIDRRSPGRAIVSVGGDAPVAIQTAFGGASYESSRRCVVAPHELFAGPTEPQGRAEQGRGESELAALVAMVVEASASRVDNVRPLWAEPLPASLDWIDLGAREAATPNDAATGAVAIGLEDVPDTQTQQPWRWDPSTGPLAVFGSSGSCAAKVLMSIGASLTSTEHDDVTHLYVIDGDAGRLRALGDLAYTGAYITLDEPDRVNRVVQFFETELATRRTAGRGARAQPGNRLVLMIDNLAAVLGSLDDNDAVEMVDRLGSLARDGAPLGVHLVVTARTVRDIGHRLNQQFRHRLVLALADLSGYLTLGLRAREVPVLPAMRAIDLNAGSLVQLVEPPVLHDWSSSATLVPEHAPAPIGSFPRQLALAELPVAWSRGERLHLPIGIEADELEVSTLELRAAEHVLVVANDGLGRSTVLRVMLHQLDRSELDVGLLRVAPRSSPLRESELPGRLVTQVGELEMALDEHRSVVLVIDDAERLDRSLVDRLAQLVDHRPEHVRIVAATTPTFARSPRAWVSKIRTTGTGVLLSRSPTDGDVFGLRLPKLVEAGRLPGRGYIISGGQACPVQLANVDQPREVENAQDEGSK